MDLVERYLAAIAAQLPKSQRDDVVAELRDDILSRIEERESVLGRPLGTGETEDLLREVGHPLVVAARYWPVQRLIGPETFPFYLWFLRTALLIVVGVQVILVGVGMATSAPQGVQALNALPGGLIGSLVAAFGWVTLVFAGLEYFGIQKSLMRKWKPSDLPAPTARRRRSRFDLVFEAAAGTVFVLWWAGVIHFSPWLRGGDQSIALSLSPAWAPFRWPILALSILQVAGNVAEFVRPALARLNAGARVIAHGGSAAIVALLLSTGAPLVNVTGRAAPAEAAHLQAALQLALTIGFGFAAAIMAIQALVDLWRLMRGAPPARLACI